ncbi:hypothetical protein AB1N83_005092 [Pleurotus pulmonarius]
MEETFVEAKLTVVYSENVQDPGRARHDLTRLGLPHPKKSLNSISLLPPQTVQLVWPTLQRGSSLHLNLKNKTRPSAIKSDLLDTLGISYIDYDEREILEHGHPISHTEPIASPKGNARSGLECVKHTVSTIPTVTPSTKDKLLNPVPPATYMSTSSPPRRKLKAPMKLADAIPSSTALPSCDTHRSSGNALHGIALKSQRLLELQKDLSRTLSRSRLNAPHVTGSSTNPNEVSIQRLEERLEHLEQALSQERRRRIRAEEKLANICGKGD